MSIDVLRHKFYLLFFVIVISYFLLRVVLLRIFMVAEEFFGLPPDGVQV